MASFTQDEGAAAATPAANTSVIYVKTDGLWYSKDDAGTEYRLSQPYEEGAWTPVFAGTGTAGTFTYAANGQVGRYKKSGNTVFISGTLSITAISVSPTGNMRITGLPFTSLNITNLIGGIYFTIISNFNYSASALQLVGRVLPGSAFIELLEVFDNGPIVEAPAANFTNASCVLTFSGEYFI